LPSIRLHQEREANETAYDGRQVIGMGLHRRRGVLVRMTETAGGWGGQDHQ
jgi:hypothetical protein